MLDEVVHDEAMHDGAMHDESTADADMEAFLSTTWHLSSKMTNSNASPCTVRVGIDAKLNLPYVSVRTCVDERSIPISAPNRQVSSDNYLLDIMNGLDPAVRQQAQEAARKKEELKNLRNGIVVAPKAQAKPNIKDVYSNLNPKRHGDMIAASRATHVNWNGEISSRVKQIFLPNASEGYSGAAILMSYGLMEATIRAYRAAIEASKTRQDPSNMGYLDLIPYSIGGNKPNNVGFNISKSYTKLFATGFKLRNKDFADKMGVLHGNLLNKVSSDRRPLVDYVSYIRETSWTKYEMDKHRWHVSRIVNGYLNAASRMASGMTAEEVESMNDDLEIGLLDISKRGGSWTTLFNRFVMKKIVSEHVKNKGFDIKLDYGFVSKIVAECAKNSHS
jgi:hypothetical protein